jgi:hypothetical protein
MDSIQAPQLDSIQAPNWTNHFLTMRITQPNQIHLIMKKSKPTLDREHGWYTNFTLYRGYTLSPWVMFSPSRFTLPRCLVGSHYKASSKSILHLPIRFLPVHKLKTSRTPLDPHKPSRCSITWRKLITWPGLAHLASWLHCFARLLLHEPVLRILSKYEHQPKEPYYVSKPNNHHTNLSILIRFLVTMLLKRLPSHVS